MKKVKTLVQIFLTVLILISLSSSFVEYDISKRNYYFSQEDYTNGFYKEKFKTIEDVNENRINSYEYIYGVFTFRLVLDSIILLFLIAFFIMNKRN